jgi:hypothetical protein
VLRRTALPGAARYALDVIRHEPHVAAAPTGGATETGPKPT